MYLNKDNREKEKLMGKLKKKFPGFFEEENPRERVKRKKRKGLWSHSSQHR